MRRRVSCHTAKTVACCDKIEKTTTCILTPEHCNSWHNKAIHECNEELQRLSKQEGFAFIKTYLLQPLCPESAVGECDACNCKSDLVARVIDSDGDEELFCEKCINVDTQIGRIDDEHGQPIDLCPECNTLNIAGFDHGYGYFCYQCKYTNSMWGI